MGKKQRQSKLQIVIFTSFKQSLYHNFINHLSQHHEERHHEYSHIDDRLEADIPLVDGVPCRTAEGAGKIIQYHSSDTPRTVVNGRSKTESTASIARGTYIRGCIGESSCRTDQTTISRTQITSIHTRSTLVISRTTASIATSVTSKAVGTRSSIPDSLAGSDTIPSRQILHQFETRIAGYTSRVIRAGASNASRITCYTSIISFISILTSIT